MSDDAPDGLPFRRPDGLLRREDFTPERLRWLAAEAAKRGDTKFLPEEVREASLKAMLAKLPAGEDVWVFAYGSLMWNPAIHVAESARAKLYGYHRAFCLSLRFGRGSPEAPGLMLGLMPGGMCQGIAHRIAAGAVESELRILWMREMLSGAYVPRRTAVRLDRGAAPAVTFVINRAHARYEGRRPPEEAARRIAAAAGHLGTNRDYLYRTVAELDRLGLADTEMHRLAARVRAIAGETSGNEGD